MKLMLNFIHTVTTGTVTFLRHQ